jgi:hypothetical protein
MKEASAVREGTFTLRTHGNLQASHRDDKFGVVFDRAAEGAEVRVLRTAVRAPLMNSVRERFLGNVRRECLDHLIILSAPHLRHVLAESCMTYFNLARPHQGIGQRIPIPAEHLPTPLVDSVTAMPCSAGFIMRTKPRREGRG